MKNIFLTLPLLIIAFCINAQIQLGDTISEYGSECCPSFAGKIEMPDSRHISTLEKKAVPMQYGIGGKTLYNYQFNKNQQTWILQDTFPDIINFARPDSNTLVLWQNSVPSTFRVFDYTAGNWVQRGDEITNSSVYPDYRYISLEMKSDSVFTVSDFQTNQTFTYVWIGSVWTSLTPLPLGGTYHDTHGDSLLIIGRFDGSDIKVYKKFSGIWNLYGSAINSLPSLRSVSFGSDQTIAISGGGIGRVFDISNNVWTQRGADVTISGAGQLGQEMQMINANKIALIDPTFNNNSGLFATYDWNNGSSMWSPDAIIQGVYGIGHGFSMPNEDFLALGTTTSPSWFDWGSNHNAVVAYSFCNAVNTSDYVTACQEFTWIDGNTYTDSNYSAKVTLSTINGCDSVVTLNLTILNVDASVTPLPPSIEANAVSATYQWIDCSTGLPIDSAFSKVFVAQTNGSYAVVVTQNGCSDTSLCTQVNNVGLNNLVTSSNIKVYPNPTNGKLTIDAKNFEGVEVYDVSGRLINKSELKTIDLEGQSKGLYLLKINANGTTQEFKVLKE